MNNEPLVMPDFRPVYQNWKEKLVKLEPNKYVLVNDLTIKPASIHAACRRNSLNGKRFCYDAKQNAVWRVV